MRALRSPHQAFGRATRRRCTFLAGSLMALALVAASSPAVAQEEGPIYRGPHLGRRVFLSSDLIGTYNALGVALFTNLIDRRVYDVDPDLGIEWSYLQTSLGFMVSPAYAQVSMNIEWQPAAVLQLRADYTAFGFFGTQGGLHGFQSADEAYDVDRDDSLPGQDKAALGHRGLFRPVLAVQVGPVILRNQLDMAVYSVDSESSHFYEMEYDFLLARTDLLIFNQTQLLIEAWRVPREAMLLVGSIYDVARSLESDIRRQRVGGVVVLQPKDPWGPLDRFRVYLMAGWILEDRNRENEPFVILGVGTDKDLL